MDFLIQTYTLAVEFLSPVLAAVVIVAILDLTLLALTILGIGSSFRNLGWALRSALATGSGVALMTVLLLPAATHASWSNLQGTIDYLGLLGIAVGLGLAAAAAVFFPIQFLLGMDSGTRGPRRARRR